MKLTTGNRKVQRWSFITVNYWESVSDFYIFVLCHFQETAINIANVTGPFIRKCLEISFWPSLSALQALTGTESHASLLDKEVRRKWAGTHQRESRIIGRDSPPCTRSLRGLITEIQRKEENKKTVNVAASVSAPCVPTSRQTGRAWHRALTVSARVSSARRPCHHGISSWRSGPAPDQHFEGETRSTLGSLS